MAKKRSANTHLSNLKRWGIVGAWLAVVVTLVLIVALGIMRDNDNPDTLATGIAAGAQTQQDGNALQRVKLPSGASNTTVTYPGFTVHFNPEYHIPNCVVYELTREESYGKRDRQGNFTNDTDVKGCANPWDYTSSGYDRGHMAPAGDMKWSADAMNASFMMTNVCPQRKSLNSGAWNDLEIKVREWARRYGAVVVATGPVLSRDMATIGKSRVAVPRHFFKVLLAERHGKRIALAFIYPNKPCNEPMSAYVVSVDEVERRTGIDFFAALPDDEENNIEARSNINQWNHR